MLEVEIYKDLKTFWREQVLMNGRIWKMILLIWSYLSFLYKCYV